MTIGANMICAFAIISVFLFSSCAFATDICDDPRNTYEINQCLSLERESAEKVLNTYFAESKNANIDNSEALAAISKAQEEWVQYRDAHCNSFYAMYRDGTYAVTSYMACMLELTYTRTHELWESYLTGPGMGQILPEPKRPIN